MATLALDPERLLWVPGSKLISIPEPHYDLPPHYEWLVSESLIMLMSRLVIHNTFCMLTRPEGDGISIPQLGGT